MHLFLDHCEGIGLFIFFSSPFSMKETLSKTNKQTKQVAMQILYDTFEFNNVVIEFMEIVKSGIKM